MKLKKSTKYLFIFILAMLISALVIPLVFAAVPGPAETFGKVGEMILTIFGFEWITEKGDKAIGAFMRLNIFIFVFTILYFVTRQIFPAPGLQRNAAMTIAIVLAIISTIFIPIDILLAIGETYATVVSFIMLGIPLTALGYLYWLTWPLPGKLWVAIRIAVLLLLWIILSVITAAVGGGL